MSGATDTERIAPAAAIAGAGLAGCLMAITLARRGLPVVIYERRPDMRKVDIPAGRSINLALSTRGLTALASVGLDAKVLEQAIPMRGRVMHSVAGDLTFQPYGRDGEAINSVSRRLLNELLMTEAEAAGVRIEFETRVRDVDVRDGRLTLENPTTKERWTSPSSFVIGADGVFSAIRQRMMRRGRFDFSQTYLEHGYKELTIPPGPDGEFQLDPNGLHIWPRHDFMMIALPNQDFSFTCTLFMRHDGAAASFEALDSPAQVRAFFEREFPDAVPMLTVLDDEFAANPVGNLIYITCSPYNHGERALLIGDAAHAIVPFYGQGMNAAFEDCTIFDQLLDKHGVDQIGRVIQEFSATRQKDAEAITELALYNFLVMRDYVVDPAFLRRKALEHVLEDYFRESYRSLYGMVTFSNLPYSDAWRIASEQTAWLDAAERAEGDAQIAGLLALAWTKELANA